MLGPGRAHTTINQPTPHIQQGKCTAWLLCLSMLQRISSRKTLVVGKKYVRGLPSNILMKISSLKWCQSRKPAGWFCIISISNFGWSHLFSLQSLGSVGCACPSELSSLGAPGSPMAKGHCSQCERALPLQAMAGGLCQCAWHCPLRHGWARARRGPVGWHGQNWSCCTWELKSMDSWRRVLHASPAQVQFHKLVQMSLISGYYGFHL